jgi:hypothetical protein
MIASIDDVIGGDVDKKMDAFSRSLDFFVISFSSCLLSTLLC